MTDLTGQPHVPSDPTSEVAHARAVPMWLALLKVAPDARTAPTTVKLAERMDLLDAHRTRSDCAAIGQRLPDLHAAAAGPDSHQVRQALR
ncbi:hypothetical protein RB614_36430 [Phytohabitans sp. ZYX-F-186]|uniref:DUF222 domain-containing protein n=1 Tax=Phytohabitans maris TaxID=3071409 RepID=A0ABU0ZSP7_9ACTN|nr:hypothetical protein [Phytohabitans sp. ZYX-F-186]MDQ7910000.1 hypothetical protein [Phytohabitans sp. ZYX-F-186]